MLPNTGQGGDPQGGSERDGSEQGGSERSAAESLNVPSAVPLRRLVLAYVALFAVLGVHIPFYPRFLSGRGFGPQEVGAIVTGAIVLRAVLAPVVGSAADRGWGRPRHWCMGLLLASFAAVGLLAATSSALVGILATAVAGGAYATVVPLLDGMVTSHARAQMLRPGKVRPLRYGRVRLWGSGSFLITCVLSGRWLEGRSMEWVLGGMGAALAMSMLCVACLPQTPRRSRRVGSAPLRELLQQRPFVVLCVTVGLLQGSHAAYYAFSVEHWSRHGLGEGVSGWLWAEGVAAEIVLFAVVGRRLEARPTTLLCAAAAAGALRWAVTASTTQLGALVAVQWLHGLTFGLTHLAAIAWMGRHVDDEHMGSAQTFLAAVAAGMGVGAVTWWSGSLYRDHGGGAFWWMACLSVLGGGSALVLRRVGGGPSHAVERTG